MCHSSNYSNYCNTVKGEFVLLLFFAITKDVHKSGFRLGQAVDVGAKLKQSQ